MSVKMQSRFKILSVGLLLLTVTACSAVRFSYNNAQELTYWWLNSYVQFTAEQKPVIKAELAKLHEWHRFNEVPVYIDILQSLHHQAEHDITSKQSCEVMESVRERYRMLNLQLEPIIEKIAPSLSHEQLTHIQKHFEKNNKKWQKEWLEGTQEQRDERRLERSIKRAEMFYGHLSEQQKDILKENVRHSTFDPHYSYSERVKRQHDAITTLKKIIDQQLGEADIKLEVAAYFDRFLNGDMAYQRYIERFKADACEDLSKLHNATSPAQRKRAANKLAGYAEDFQALKSSAQLRQ
jgi:hypothetical protein